MLVVDRIVVLVKDVSFEELVSAVDQNIVSLDVTVPAIFFIEVFIDRLTILVYWDRFSSNRVSLLEVIFTSESVSPTEGHQDFLIDQSNPAFDESEFFFRTKVVKSLHNEVFFVLQIMNSIAEESAEEVPDL